MSNLQDINENSSKFEKIKHYIDIEDKITKEQLKTADMILNELSLEEVQELAEVLLNGQTGGL